MSDEKLDAIDNIKGQLSVGYIDLGLHDDMELAIINDAIALYEKEHSIVRHDRINEPKIIPNKLTGVVIHRTGN